MTTSSGLLGFLASPLMMMRSFSKNSTVRVSILQFDAKEHRFCPSLCFSRESSSCSFSSSDTDDNEQLTLDQAQALLGTQAVPSAAWTRDYLEWRNWTTMADDVHHHEPNHHHHPHHPAIPHFASTAALHAFNEKGRELVERLRQEMQQHAAVSPSSNNKKETWWEVDDFVPLLSSVQVGEGWWHVRDCGYGFVVPIQHLPVSDELKSRLQAWRFQKTTCLLKSEEESCQLHATCHELEDCILLELNAKSDHEPTLLREKDQDNSPTTAAAATTAAPPVSPFTLCAWNHSSSSSEFASSL